VASFDCVFVDLAQCLRVFSDGLKKYFSQFGKVRECTIMRDPTSGKSRGFAFLTFEEPKSVNTVMVREHFLDGKIVSCPYRGIAISS
jgi:RNA-binding protein Musashi